MAQSTDRIEKKVLLRAPRERVWRAISDSTQFGSWFGAAFDGPFIAGQRLGVSIQPTQVDPEVAKMQEPYRGMRFEVHVEKIEPLKFFSFRWHPSPIEPGADLSKEPMTLVAFQLEEAPGGTLLTITETGFDQLPLERRAKAFEGNDDGWTHQAKLIEKYLRPT
jgi:uncharacterized protein YndB with AHSA1/START domain